MERLFRFRIVMIALPTVIGFLIWTNVELISEMLYLNYRVVATGSAWLIAMGIGYFLMVYLTGGIKLPIVERLTESMKPSYDNNNLNSKNTDEIEALKNKISDMSYSQLQLKEGQQEAIIKELRATVSNDLAALFEREYSASVLSSIQLKQAKENFSKSIERLTKEIDILTRRANLNLVIGVLTTAIAVSLLAYMVLGNDANLDTLTGLLSYYLPRVTVVIFIEVFSFFFLKMYKSNLAEIKFYQQEITKISTQQVIYENSVLSKEDGDLGQFVQYSLNQVNQSNESPQTQNTSVQIEHLSKVVQETSKIISNISKSNAK